MNYFDYAVLWAPTGIYIALMIGGAFLFGWILFHADKVKLMKMPWEKKGEKK